MGCFAYFVHQLIRFRLTSASRGPSAIAEVLFDAKLSVPFQRKCHCNPGNRNKRRLFSIFDLSTVLGLDDSDWFIHVIIKIKKFATR